MVFYPTKGFQGSPELSKPSTSHQRKIKRSCQGKEGRAALRKVIIAKTLGLVCMYVGSKSNYPYLLGDKATYHLA